MLLKPPESNLFEEIAGERDPDDDEPYWEANAKAAVSQILASAEFDVKSRTLIVEWDGWGNYKDPQYDRRDFTDMDELREALEAVAEEILTSNVPWEDGEPVFSTDGSSIVYDALEAAEVEEFFESGRVPDDRDAQLLLGPDDTVHPEHLDAVRVDLEEIGAELVAYLAQHPRLMRELSDRKFEELVAELFYGMGYEVVLTPPTKDGGFDLKAYRKEPYGMILTLVECKKYGSHHRVDVPIVRALHSVVETQDAGQGVIATTSTFTRGAKELRDKLRFRLNLCDGNRLAAWCKAHKRRR